MAELAWFAVGTLSFWVLGVFLIAAWVMQLMEEEFGWGFFTGGVAALILYFVGHLSAGNVVGVLLASGAIAGGIWSFIELRWILFGAALVCLGIGGFFHMSEIASAARSLAQTSVVQPGIETTVGTSTFAEAAVSAGTAGGGNDMGFFEAIGAFFAGVAALVAVGTIGFWVLVLLAIGVSTWFLYEDDDRERLDKDDGSGVSAFIAIAVSLAVFQFVSGLQIAGWVVENIAYFMFLVLCYLGLAVGWGFIKFYFFVIRRRKIREKKQEEFAKEWPVAVSAAWLAKNGRRNERSSEAQSEYNSNRETAWKWLVSNYPAVVPREHKLRIMRWMMFWPWSIVVTVLNNLGKIYTRIYEMMEGTLKRIVARVWSGISDELPQA